jgi:hypothetical protein
MTTDATVGDPLPISLAAHHRPSSRPSGIPPAAIICSGVATVYRAALHRGWYGTMIHYAPKCSSPPFAGRPFIEARQHDQEARTSAVVAALRRAALYRCKSGVNVGV